MNATEIVELVRIDGPDGVASSLGCSRRQAEQIAIQAMRAVRDGRELPVDAIPSGTVARSMAVHPAGQPRIGHAFTDAEVREMADAIIPPALVGLTAEEHYQRQRIEQERLRRERNAANDHPEVDPRVAEHVRSLPPKDRARLEQNARSLPL